MTAKTANLNPISSVAKCHFYCGIPRASRVAGHVQENGLKTKEIYKIIKIIYITS